MIFRRRILTGSGMILGAQVGGQSMSFVRNIIIARLISQDDFGVASTLIISITLVEMLGDLSIDRLLVQAKDGDEPDFQKTAQMFQAIRGLGVAVSLFVLAWPISRLFNIEHARWALQCVALVPLIRGFAHLDSKRLHRDLRFGPDAAAALIPHIALVLLAWPLARWLGDYSAVLWLLIVQAAIMVVVTHVFATRKYAWTWNRQIASRMVSFGWPLLLNGILMSLILQGDRIVIGSAYDMAQLAVYTVAFTVTWQVSMLFVNCSAPLLLPVLSRAHQDPEHFAKIYAISLQLLCLTGIFTSTGFFLLGQPFVEIAFGSKYSGVGTVIGWLGLMQALRIIRSGPTVASVALNDTVSPLIANVARVAVFPAILVVATYGWSLVWVALIGCLGEAIAFTTISIRLQQRHCLHKSHCVRPLLLFTGTICTVLVIALYCGRASLVYLIPSSILVAVSATIVMAIAFPELRRVMVSFTSSVD